MNATTPTDDDDLPEEIDFSDGTRGKFYGPNARLNLPVYLDDDVEAYLAALAARKGVPLSVMLFRLRASHCRSMGLATQAGSTYMRVWHQEQG